LYGGDMAELEFHEYAAIFEMMEGDRFDELVADIKQKGLFVPIVLFEGKVLDGRNRYMACRKAGVEPRFVEWTGPGLATDYVWSLNASRRHLVGNAVALAAGRYAIARESEARDRQGARTDLTSLPIGDEVDYGKSVEKAAEKFGIAPRTVSRATKVIKDGAPELQKAVNDNKVSVSAAAEIATLPKAEQPAIVAKTEEEIIKAANRIKRDRKQAKKAEREQYTASRAAEVAPAAERYNLHNEPCINALSRAPSAFDWIITDPPYPREFLPVYDDLAEIAEHSLKPGGSLLCMIGQSYLPDIVASLSRKLSYHWTLAYLTPGGQATFLHARNVNTFWKPILWFTKGEYTGAAIGDTTRSAVNDNDKTRHHWGQSESGMLDLMQRFVRPGDTVMDPFMGAGTTGVVALELGASFVGYDIDKKFFDESKVRIGDERLAQAA
jgi:16S rRNA G966 N2-methylase RsmD